MPGIDGLALAEQMFAAPVPPPIVFLSAHGDVPATARAMKDGAVDFLEKPVCEEDLLDALGRAVARSREQIERMEGLRELRERYARLTPRERQVCALVVSGLIITEARERGIPWRKWGPYLSERQWGTVREDYSADGDAWNYFTHDQARSRAYRWGEDGLAGFSDEKQRLCFSLALWNGWDPVLKERLYGLTNNEGNHGEDVKEYYFYLDSTPTHSYMKWLYKYPQAAYPYVDLIETNRRRNRGDMEYELLDTGIFTGDRYFDVVVEYAKQTPEDILIQITAVNR